MRRLLALTGFALTGLALTLFGQPPWAESFQSAVAKLQDARTVAQALQCFDTLWKNNPKDPQLATWIGASLDAAAHHRDATPWYGRALAIQPDFEPALNDLALNYAALGELSKSRALLRRALEVNPSNTRATYNLGLVALRLHDYEEAARAFARARQSANLPASADQLAMAEATARFHLREYAQTAKLLENASSSSTSDRSYGYLLLLGSAKALAGDLPSAIKTLQAAVSAAPGDPQAYYRLALVFMLGRLDHEAQDVLAAGLKQLHDSPLLLFGEAVSSESHGEFENAAAFLKHSLDANPQQAQAWALLGKIDTEMGATDDALKAYAQAAALESDAGAGVDRVQLLIRLQRFSEAEAELQALAKRYPDNAKVNLGFGKLYREQGRFELAEKHLRRAIQLDSDNADAHFALGEVFRLTHRADQARSEFAIFKQKKPARDASRLLELAAASSSEASSPTR